MKVFKPIAAIIFSSIGYAVVRYHLFGDVPFRLFPLYVANKGTAMASLILLGLSLIARTRENRKKYGKAGFFLMIMHGVMSMAILSPAYFKKYFRDDGTYFANIEAGLAFGIAGAIIATYLFVALPNGNGSPSLRLGVGRLILVVTGVHAALLGYPTWQAYSSWPGYLPPITLLATGTAITMLAIRAIGGRDEKY